MSETAQQQHDAVDEVMIELRGMHKWYDKFHVLKDINLTVHKGERIVVCGPSGSGKSTMIRCINRLEEHQRGQIIVDGTELTVDYTVTPLAEAEKQALLIEMRPLSHLLRIDRDETVRIHQATTREMIRGLAHEIKNPLGGIRGAAQLLAAELPEEELKDYTNIIIEETDRLRKLVDRLLETVDTPRSGM